MRRQELTCPPRARALAALVLFASVVLASPSLHHDLACHATSPGHCEACLATPPASRAETGAAAQRPETPRGERVEGRSDWPERPAVHARATDRAPPA
jgi:hypothetical protein